MLILPDKLVNGFLEEKDDLSIVQTRQIPIAQWSIVDVSDHMCILKYRIYPCLLRREPPKSAIESLILTLLPPSAMEKISSFSVRRILLPLLVLSLYPAASSGRSYVLFLSQDDINDITNSPDDIDPANLDSPEWDEFGDADTKTDEELDPGSWRPIFETDSDPALRSETDALYYSGVSKMVSSASSGDERTMEEAASEIEASAVAGNPHAQSALGFLYGMGQMRERSKAKALLYHHFAAEAGNMQSKMALAYTYSRQDVSDNFESDILVNGYFVKMTPLFLVDPRILQAA